MVNQYEIFWVDLNPTRGAEMQKTRPCVIISPKEMNNHLKTVLVATITSTITKYPFRINCIINDKNGQICLDHIRSIDKTRIQQKIGKLDLKTVVDLKNKLKEMLID